MKLKKFIQRGFSGGPYNPRLFKTLNVPRHFPTDKEVDRVFQEINEVPVTPVRNFRHVNPVRQSGPIPAYDGTYTMEDIKKVLQNTSIPSGVNGCHHEPEELMRRVPGLTRKEAERIITLGFTPDEEVDFAYLAHNCGIDVFYEPNYVYVGRQVVSDSKGQKQEIYFNQQAFEDISLVNVSHAPTQYMNDYHWEIFLWGEMAIHPLVDFDLSVPDTWFEYEEESWSEWCILEDQATLPDEMRRISRKHPNCNKELFYSQEQLDKFEEMKDPEWTPKDLKYNVYQKEGFVGTREVYENNDRRIL